MSEAILHGNIVVEAMDAFLNSTDVNSAIENALARGGDISARAVIAGSIAEVFYGVPNGEKEWCNGLLPENMLEVLDRFDKTARRIFLTYEADGGVNYFGGELIENAIRQFHRNNTDENFGNLIRQLYYEMRDDGNVCIPLIYDDGKRTDDYEYLTYRSADGKKFVAAYTSEDEDFAEKYPDTYLASMKDIFAEIADDDAEEDGIIFNPENKELMFPLDKELLKMILEYTPPENKMFFYDGNIKELHVDATVSSDCDDFKDLSFENFANVTAAHFMKKLSSDENNCVIYTPLMFYDGDDEQIILECFYSCLDLARKYRLASVAFPECFVGSLMNKAVGNWFSWNKDYGMTVIAATGKEEDIDDGKERHFSDAELDYEELPENYDDDEPDDFFEYMFGVSRKSKNYTALIEQAKKQYPEYRADVKPTDADKQRTRDFAATFSDREKFWDALKSKGITWNENADPKINDMWARNALSKVIACGFDPKDAVALFAPTIDGVSICKEISLSSYWQGFDEMGTAVYTKYLLVTQEWGSLISASDEMKDALLKITAGDYGVFYPFDLNSTADRNLIELFKVLNCDITRSTNAFFTNFCLGCRLGNGGGNLTKDLMMRDAPLFLELCEILEPENILCLGKLTSECVYETLSGRPFEEIYRGAKSYNDFLDNHPPIKISYGSVNKNIVKFYPLETCDDAGTAIRSLDAQKRDWEKIFRNTDFDPRHVDSDLF